jgi:hypothetical protein
VSNVDLADIRQRNERLEAAKLALKDAFVGIDTVIDELVDAVRIWYLMPDVLTRPVIVNLWGMTGVGKTDLVRKLVRELDLMDRFGEVELSNGDETSWYSSVTRVLESNNLNDTGPKIVLFDEIQRFNTLDSEGKPLTTTKFTDFWELLSDGRLSRRAKEDIDRYLAQMTYQSRDLTRRKAKGEEVDVEYGVDIWEAQQLKQLLASDEDMLSITDMSRAQIIERMTTARTSKTIYEPVSHAKTLIIISGNLDEAFSMSGMTSEADVDADIFHAFTEQVTVIDVKRALAKRFKPEQVSRFGNIHIVYTSLRKRDFVELIRREITKVAANTMTSFGIELVVSDAVHELVYRNGVFPVQGVRPVFSSVADIVETNLARFLFEALMNKATRIELDHLPNGDKVIGTVFKAGRKSPVVTLEVPYIGRLDKVRQNATVDVVANVSAHEAGHAVAYAVQFGLAPLQLSSRVTSSYAAGFTFPHTIHSTRGQIISQIKVFLAGGLAEELLFGKDQATIGRSADRETATMLALDYVRRYGFDEEYQAVYTLDFGHAMDKSVTDLDVEKMLARLVAETRQLLSENIDLLKSLAKALNEKGELKAEEVSSVCGQFNVVANVRPEAHLHLPPYNAELNA